MRTFRLVEGVAGVTLLLVAAACGNTATGGLAGGFGGGSTGAGASTGSSKGGAGGATASSNGGATASTSSSSSGTGTASTSSSSSGTGTASTSSSSSGTGTASTSSSSGGVGGASTSTSSGGVGGAAASSSSGGVGGASTSTSSGAVDGGAVTFGGQCNGTSTVLTGTVYAPNGKDPIPKVRVYAAIQINPYPANYCDKCSAPIDPVYVFTVSAADGTFSLNLDFVPAGATVDFAIQIGRFRKHTLLPVTACQSQVVTAAAETLPGSSTAGDIPKIAVSAGNTDHLDTVLTALGITEFDCYEGRANPYYPYGGSCTALSAASKTIADVLQNATPGDPTAITSYNMAFISCAPGAYQHYISPPDGGAGNDQAAMTTNTKSWVGAGGRLFVTDTAYDYIAQAFPPDITWAGAAGAPQPVDGANVGCAPAAGTTSAHAVPYTITVDDPTLSAWLKVVGFPAPVTVQGFYEPWSTMSSLATTSTLIANGTMPIDPKITGGACTTANTTMTNVPLTAEFDVPTCGRVIFSSYHTYTGTGASATAANQKIMEYLIFDAAYCSG